MDRYWFLTWTTYGTWLPGDDRGFVSTVRDKPGPRVRHNIPQTPYDKGGVGLRASARSKLKGAPVLLNADIAPGLMDQFYETAKFRGWQILAAAIMANHVHLVVGVKGDPDPETLLRDFKSYGSRAMNRQHTRPPSGTWWTESGSRRRLPDESAVLGAVAYVQKQPFALKIR